MTDRLERALRALREGETGTNPRSEETLDRILASRRDTSGTWARRARSWIPIAAVLVVATSALARSGAIGVIRTFVEGRSEVVETRGDGSTPDAPLAPAPPQEEGTPASSAQPAESEGSRVALAPAPAPVSVPTPAPASVPTPAPVSAPTAVRPPAPASAPTSTPALPSASTPEPASALGPSEADVYSRAHHLHFGSGNPASALAAWDDYLRRYPDGRFAPDARYNRAIDLLKMKRYAEARVSLQPFADGAYGSYHRDDARELLRSIP
jgi:hypothetical protein